ncbi:MAG: UDP-N-acetylmuramoyl-L-alanyl-D-glutamate--2,6-diaminopimelate ligase, partial [Muribaculaceae bacterium]|nr:UDP-N-acetylmuramoyl-L-alanyl-D-glutamate--2,6-diaminopimelate ligase [Muribaculaceae bacterium]
MNINNKLNELIQSVSPLKVVGPTDLTINNITLDSRTVANGDMFVAVRGALVDGHTFVGKALAAGAVAVVVEEMPEAIAEGVAYILVESTSRALAQLADAFYCHPSQKLTLVGVTGTNGKTTIATLIYEMAQLMGEKAGLLSTVANYVGRREIQADRTTPDALTINRLLAEMVEDGCTIAAMEVSSHAVVQNRIYGLDFDGAIFTNLTRDHLDYHKTVEAYRDAKKGFFDALKPEAWALTNADDRNGLFMLQNCAARHFTYSLRSLADFTGRDIENHLDGTLIAFNGTEVFTRFIGEFNVYNLTAVYGASTLIGW